MKRLVVLLIFVFSLTFVAHSQDIFVEKDKIVNIGIGLGSNLYSGVGYSGLIPPISGSFEYCIKDNLFDENSSVGVGGYFGYASYSRKNREDKWTYTNVILGGKGAIHYQFIDKLDSYAGLMIGYNIGKSRYSGNNSGMLGSNDTSVGFIWDFFLGARYYVTDNIAVMGELGYGIAYLNLGVAFRLQ